MSERKCREQVLERSGVGVLVSFHRTALRSSPSPSIKIEEYLIGILFGRDTFAIVQVIQQIIKIVN